MQFGRSGLLAGSLFGILFAPLCGGSEFILSYGGLHGVTTPKVVLYIVTAVKTSKWNL